MKRPRRTRPHTSSLLWLSAALLAAAAITAGGCGVEGRRSDPAQASARAPAPSAPASPEPTRPPAPRAFAWPSGPRPTAVLEVADRGEIHIALYPELAPRTVERFQQLASEGFYDGTQFHRVIPGFMIQGGDPNTRNADPRDDGQGGSGTPLPDEFSRAPHLRGSVSMANTGRPDSGSSQFFIVHSDSPSLNGKYSLFGRVTRGMEVVDAITRVETDELGRWGPRDRPIENVVLERVRIVAPAPDAAE